MLVTVCDNIFIIIWSIMLRNVVLGVLALGLFGFVYAAPAPGGQGGGSTVGWSSSVKYASVYHSEPVVEQVYVCGFKESKYLRLHSLVTQLVEANEVQATLVYKRLANWLDKANTETKRYCLVETLTEDLGEMLGMEDATEDDMEDSMDESTDEEMSDDMEGDNEEEMTEEMDEETDEEMQDEVEEEVEEETVE